MKIQPINSIECALIHNRFAPMNLQKLVDVTAVQTQKAGIVGSCELMVSGDGKAVLAAGDFRIAISQNDVALPKAGFGGCLPQPITVMMMPDAEQRVINHRAHTFISITRSPEAADNDEVDEDSESKHGDFLTSRDSLLAMKLGYLLTDVLHRNNPATAIHWLPSDHLVSPQVFELASQAKTLTQFFIRPYLYSSAGAIGEGNPVGLVANGSQYMMDRPVIFEEAQVDYQWMIRRMTQFIDQVIKEQSIPGDGEAFKPSEDEIIEVLHRAPDPSNPMGSYTLVARNVPKFGIRGGLHSILLTGNDVEEKVDQSRGKLDANDPIDLAILNALREREREMREPANLPQVKDRRMGPRETHEAAAFGKRAVFGKR